VRNAKATVSGGERARGKLRGTEEYQAWGWLESMHIAYLGDSTIGAKVNVGASTITSNYDGKKKTPDAHRGWCVRRQ
jgi:hypothetical protein